MVWCRLVMVAFMAVAIPVAIGGEPSPLASGSDDQTIRLWNVATGKKTHRLAGHEHGVKAVAWSPDGKTLASASQDRTIRLWEVAIGKELRWLAGHERGVEAVAWSPDGKTLASASFDKTIRLWEAATGKEVRRWAARAYGVGSVAWAPDGKTLASASADKTIRLWEAATGKEVRRFTGHDAGVEALAWSPDGKRLASASHDTTLLIWAVGHHPDEAPLRLELSELNSCWKDLAAGNPSQAYRAICTLTGGARYSVPFLAERLRPVPPADPKRVSRLIDDLDNKRFSARREATVELAKLAELAEAALRRALRNNPSLETRRRLEHLLGKLNGWSGERLRTLRAIMILENIGTAWARQVLAALARATPETRLTQEAKASLDRLARRAAASVHDRDQCCDSR